MIFNYNMSDIITREGLILQSTKRYYQENPEDYKKLVDIIEKKSDISISLIEYFTLTYAKHLNTMYKKLDDNFFIVYLSYKNFLKGYGKKFTDPFRRKQNKEEGDFFMDLHGLPIKTRVAQLHFFKWAFENEVITYIEDNLEKIEKKMIEDKKKKNKKRHTRANVFPIPETVAF